MNTRAMKFIPGILFAAFLFLAACADSGVGVSEALPRSQPPMGMKWTRSLSLAEVDQKVAEQERQAEALEKDGGFFVGEWPRHAAWEKIRRANPTAKKIWVFEPLTSAGAGAGAAFVADAKTHLLGMGLALQKADGSIEIVHDVSSYTARTF